MIFPKSPINPNGGWTFLTSGSFFFKNNLEVKNFFQKVLTQNIEKVKNYYLKNISIVQQNFLIFPETISYNISFKNNLDYHEKLWIKKIYDIFLYYNRK